MDIISEIGIKNTSIKYTDRPTVKVIIRNEDKILILNNGLLPGGGVDSGESETVAIERELLEELGAIVSNVEPIATVIQYRDFLEKRYIVNGFTADLSSMDTATSPQDEGESNFTYEWYDKNAAIELVKRSISSYDSMAIRDDSQQGKLFNLKTTLEFLRRI